ncbi:hypothetical protein AKJ09_11515 [Labilithrix luteola]|uniref:Uncharacterized protein n=1 Tax=Labilithrix luteola TaxID=1391654 RepID=A0A0K1QGS0_9BACT|nr:hypothetical protein [Labilithrix luteola]AKU93369.1 hypothetical protein AKJ09_00033 [Labilithrix luteola]AKV04852.1 hypothetical protein AKJ09_11515 [Labilithrix luteola]
MPAPVASRKIDFVSAPRAFAAAGVPGQVAVIAVSAAATYIDLTRGISQAKKDPQVSGQDPKSLTRNYLTIEADTADLGVVFGATSALVSGGNAPSLTASGTVASGVYTGAAGTCYVIKAGTKERFLLQASVDNFLGLVGSAAGNARIYQSSPDDA